MTEHGLSQRQIFGVIRKNLEAKALKQFDEFHDEATLLEYAVAVLVRNALVLGDYSFFLKEQICEVFLTAKPNEAMRKFLPFFISYFSDKEYNQIILRLFKNKTSYYQHTKTAREYSKYLNKSTSQIVLPDNQKVSIESIFEDKSGKKHKWILRDADPSKKKEEIEHILEVLTLLSIFEVNGVRRFAQLVKSKRIVSEEEELVKQKAAPKKVKGKKTAAKKEQQESTQHSTTKTKELKDQQTVRTSMPTNIDPRKMDSKALRQSAKTTIPLETDLTAFHIKNTDSQTDKITTIPIATQEVPEHYLDQSSQNLSEKELEPALAAVEASAEDTESPSKLDQVTPTKKKVSKNLLNMLKRFSKGK